MLSLSLSHIVLKTKNSLSKGKTMNQNRTNKFVHTRAVIKLAVLAATFALFSSSIIGSAKEGMFTPEQLSDIAKQLRSAGLKLNASQLSDLTDFPMGAVISLGGCSASFVSDQGLVVTNHHCARGSIQFNSTEENNYLADGFLAASLDEELPAAPGSRVYVTEQVSDVTDEVLDGIKESMPDLERFEHIESNRKQLLADCEQAEGYRCQVSSFFGGAQYKLNKRLEIRDVRLVYAPADAIGRYGGDADNWLWPRHTGDFAFYRAYVSPAGLPADFSEENVPFRPKHVLTVSATGVQEGDFVMVAGYPGSTSRYARLQEVQNVFDWTYPTWVSLLEDWITAIEATAPEGSDERIKYESRLAGLNNFYKNLGGQISGAKTVGLVERRTEREAALNKWIANNDDTEGFATAIGELDELTSETAIANRKNYWYRNVKRPQLLDSAVRLYRLAKEKQKPNAEREQGFQERDMTFFTQRLQAIDRRYDADVDKAEWMVFLQGYLEQPQEQRVAAFDKFMKLEGQTVEEQLLKTISSFYQDTSLNDLDTRIALMDATTEQLEASSDPFMRLAIALYEEDIAIENASKARSGRYAVLEPKYMRSIIAWQQSQGFAAYPDANSNLRVSYGNVMGGSPRDGLRYTAFTSLEGIVEKDTGEEPFNSPQSQLALIDQEQYGDYELESLGSVPVNFMSDLDITGGNSGSATLNGRGELVGLAFDGTIESVNSDWHFEGDITRTIHVDSRYMLWVMEKIDGAQHVIDEMNISSK